MLLKRNVLALALFSAGISLATCRRGLRRRRAGQRRAGPGRATGPNRVPPTRPTPRKPGTARPARKARPATAGVKSTAYASSLRKRHRHQAQLRRASSKPCRPNRSANCPASASPTRWAACPAWRCRPSLAARRCCHIHGLGPDFSTALVNGREQVSTSNNRDVQFDQYPSSWFNNVVVHLSPAANLIGQGLAGTVDMHTIRPLEQGPSDRRGQRALHLGQPWPAGSGTRRQRQRATTVNGVYVNQFADHTFGVTLGVDLESNPAQIEHQAPWGYANDANGDLVVGGSKNYGISDQLKRHRPADHPAVAAERQLHQHAGPDLRQLPRNPAGQGHGVPAVLGQRRHARARQRAGRLRAERHLRQRQAGDPQRLQQDQRQGLEHRLEQQVTFQRGLVRRAWTPATRAPIAATMLLESYSGTGYGIGQRSPPTRWPSSELGNGLLYVNPSLDYAQQIVLTDPQGWGGGDNPPVVQAGFINAPRTNDYLASLRLSVEARLRRAVRSPAWSSAWTAAPATRPTTSTRLSCPAERCRRRRGDYRRPRQYGDPLAWMGIGSAAGLRPVDLPHRRHLPVVLDRAVVDRACRRTGRCVSSTSPRIVQFNLDTSLGNVPAARQLRRAGCAYRCRRRTGSVSPPVTAAPTGSSIVTLVPVSGGTKYTRWLPSANLVFSFTPTTDLRVGAARVWHVRAWTR